MVHCDLAARNILISEGFVLKIGDFGLSKRASDKEDYQYMTDVSPFPFHRSCVANSECWKMILTGGGGGGEAQTETNWCC